MKSCNCPNPLTFRHISGTILGDSFPHNPLAAAGELFQPCDVYEKVSCRPCSGVDAQEKIAGAAGFYSCGRLAKILRSIRPQLLVWIWPKVHDCTNVKTGSGLSVLRDCQEHVSKGLCCEIEWSQMPKAQPNRNCFLLMLGPLQLPNLQIVKENQP